MDMMWYRRRGLMVTSHIKSVTGAIASFNSDYNKIPIKSLICDIEPIQEGTGDPSPENVRPISGRTGAKVTRAGKNLLSDQTVYKNGSAYFVGGQSVNVYPFYLKAGTYTFAYDGLSSYCYWQLKGTSTNNIVSSNEKKYGTFTLPVDGYYRFWFYQPSVSSVDDFYNIQLELGSAATEYEPYQGETISVNWESEAGTVYGGTLDIVSGKLTVSYKYYENAGTGNWSTVETGGNRYYIDGITVDALNSDTTGWCNIGALITSYYKTGINVSSNGRISLCGDLYSAFASVDALKAYLAEHPLQIVYKLATPTEIQLTPQEVKTILGVNNIWCDSGDVTVDYWKWGK